MPSPSDVCKRGRSRPLANVFGRCPPLNGQRPAADAFDVDTEDGNEVAMERKRATFRRASAEGLGTRRAAEGRTTGLLEAHQANRR
jgi:hypothetical protein